MATKTEKLGRAVRNAVCDCSSGPTYYQTKGHAFHAVNDALAAHGFHAGAADLPGDSGRALLPIYPGTEDDGDHFFTLGYVVFGWYRMRSGRYELTAYVS